MALEWRIQGVPDVEGFDPAWRVVWALNTLECCWLVVPSQLNKNESMRSIVPSFRIDHTCLKGLQMFHFHDHFEAVYP